MHTITPEQRQELKVLLRDIMRQETDYNRRIRQIDRALQTMRTDLEEELNGIVSETYLEFSHTWER